MKKYSRSMVILMVLGGLGTVGVAGCSSDEVLMPAVEAEAVEMGTIEMHLLTTAPSGNTYRLRQAALVVQGPSSTLFFDSESDPDAPMLSARVIAGDYSVFLQDGWFVEQVNTDGTTTMVNAVLMSANPELFTVFPGQHTNVPLRFQVGPDVLNMGTFGVTLEVDDSTSGPVSQLCSSDFDCGSGQTCCMAGFLGTCSTLAAGQACPLPDLTVSFSTAQQSIVLEEQDFPSNSCALVEGCVDAPGVRRLLRFATETPNVGAADMILGVPGVEQGFEYSDCHGHYHFEGYARYELMDAQGQVVATGHKQAFCLLDSNPIGLPGAPTSPRFHCGFQGIQRGWSDVYGAYLDCQWVDVTDVVPGDYVLRISINPDQVLPESDYTNNVADIPVTVTDPALIDPLAPCTGPVFGTGRECGWNLVPGMQDVACNPGEVLDLSCGCACGGDPVLRVCDGLAPCTSGHAIAENDDACGLCSQAQAVCPASGRYSVMTGAYTAGGPYVCDVVTTPGLPQADASTPLPGVDGGI